MALLQTDRPRRVLFLVGFTALVLMVLAVLVLHPGSEPDQVAPPDTGSSTSSSQDQTTTTAPATTTAPGTSTSGRTPGTGSTAPPATTTTTPVAPPSGPGTWKFLVTTADSYSLLRWPCGAIHWGIEPGDTPDQAADATAVVGELAARTGRSFVFDGAGSPDQPVNGQIVVSFNPARIPPGALGYGGPIKAPGVWNFKIQSGLVAVTAPRGAEKQILRHEFAHNMGLDNVSDSHEVMYWQHVPMSGWGPGTDHALANVGPCYP
jgi:hypothetical protein